MNLSKPRVSFCSGNKAVLAKLEVVLKSALDGESGNEQRTKRKREFHPARTADKKLRGNTTLFAKFYL